MASQQLQSRMVGQSGQQPMSTLPCQSCDRYNGTDCPGINLCGKTVLYVGGMVKLVPHYRDMVEKIGGRFLHHDGGREASRQLLPKKLSTADLVVCPIDCVSHFACKCVKRICKKERIPLVFMRSSSMASFARGLHQLQ